MTKKFIAIALLLITFCFPGCIDREIEFSYTKRSPQDSAMIALRSDNADDRYYGLKELADSKAFHADWSVKAMGVIARTDSNDSVRALAAHNLGRIGDERVWPILTEALGDPSAKVQAEAAWGLDNSTLIFNDETKEVMADAQKALLKLLISQTSIDAKLNAARALSKFESREVLEGLIASLNDPEFEVRYEAKQSLMKLTGQNFNDDSSAWQKWLNNTDDPFANTAKPPTPD